MRPSTAMMPAMTPIANTRTRRTTARRPGRSGLLARLAVALAALSGTALHAQVPTTIVLTVSNNNPTYVTPAYGGNGTTLNPVTVTARVTVTTSGQPVTGGSVTFYDNAGSAGPITPYPIGTSNIQYNLPGTEEPPDAIPGTATLAFAFGPGTHSITATYNGTAGGLATSIFPATPNYLPSTTVSPTALTSTGFAASSFGFAVDGPGSYGSLGYFNQQYSYTSTIYGWAANPAGTNSFVFGYGLQVPTGTSTVTDTTTGTTFTLPEQPTSSVGQFNPAYQPVFATTYQGPGIGPFGNYINELGAGQITSFSLADVYQSGVPAWIGVSTAQNVIWVTSLYGNVNGFGAKVAVANAPSQAVTADLNGDGWPDLVVAHNDTSSTGASVGVVLQNYDPVTSSPYNPTPPFNVPETVYQLGHPIGNVAVGDLNGDGFPDIVAVSADGSNLIYVLINNGEGGFTPTGNSFLAGVGASQLALADFNGDGKLDIAILNTTDATIGILLGNGDGTFQTMVPYPVGTNPIAFSIADLNVDGYLDFAIANSDSATQAEVSFLYGQPGGTFTYTADLTDNQLYMAVENYPEAYPHPTVIQATDLNGDGYPDLFIGFNINQFTWAIYNPATGQYVYSSTTLLDEPNSVNLRTISPGVADLDGDGVKDFLLFTGVNNLLPVCTTCYTPAYNYLAFRLNGAMEPDWFGPSVVNWPLGNHTFVSSWVPAAGSIYAPTTNAGPMVLDILPNTASVSPSPFAFATIDPNTTSAPQQFAITTTGSAAVVFLDVPPSISLTGADPSNFSIAYNGCDLEVLNGFGVGSGQSCYVTVTFTPTAAANYSANLTVTDSASNSPQTAVLTGAGTGAPPLSQAVNVSETITLTDTPSASQPTLVAVNETITLTDTPSASQPTLVAVNETITLTDTPSASQPTLVAVNETITLTDTPTALSAVVINDLESISVTDTPTTLSAVVINDLESISVTDTPNPSLSATATKTILISSANPSTYAQSITLTATVSAVSPSTATGETGSVQFKVNGTSVGAPVAPNASGQATFSINTLAAGSNSITAVYSGDINFLGSTSTPLTQVVTGNILTVTAQYTSRNYEAANPAFTYAITGFVNGDTAAVLSGAPLLTTTALQNSNAGAYPIMASLGTLTAPSNYTFSFVPATLTVIGNQPQSIAPFGYLANLPVTFGSITWTIHSTSGLPVVYSNVTGPIHFTNSVMTMTGTGTVSFTVSQPGNANFAAATPVQVNFKVVP